MKKLIIASTSTLHGGSYLDYLLPDLKSFLGNVRELLFIPFARPGGISHDMYTEKVADTFSNIEIAVKGIHEYADKNTALKEAQAIFTGGGNTFLLVSQLYDMNLMSLLSDVVANGTPYLGTSAGSNITGVSMKTTNDMPIIHPPSFTTLGLVPFNINPHYIESDGPAGHMGETREMRIREFHVFNSEPVIGLREGSWLEVNGESIVLKGQLSARVFCQGKEAVEVNPGTNLSDHLRA
ncbi:MAG: dipeptidase PepE [Flavobacterium sp.]|nr:dipeptidase PepE [Flavobacterium sp.]